ncbi:MAG: hydrogenase expression/formation protein [Gammaproteobacteria bacterium]|nr:hydrogenase expression/formation protein [Gammaproteobacteria bacterium]NIR96773.1 hydrogenase expression/formation protein [Gammaproteobacteria bacterium]NIT62478.1 hydrogenase expression/formation protein [Gammaproteobacteria bacterium]NIV19413.1 hydrogenase expression/formation protein [Gammaproteobacteria bacterium]NIX10501.1 hydrogenase expression/formation protein [Gammaproteobacteria bacterium]
MTLGDIPIAVEPGGPAAPSGQVHALLHEIVAHLRHLAATGEAAGIDLCSLPLAPEDRRALACWLGRGEVTATVQALGPTAVYETAVPGVWWLTHRNSDEQIVAELIEITRCPELVVTPVQDVEDGVERLTTALGREPPDTG